MRRAAAVLEQRASVSSWPVVIWRHIQESEDALAQRVEAALATRPSLVLVAVPAGFRVPPGALAVEFPLSHFEALHPQRRGMRYKVLYGGRGSAKSWSIAISLVLDALAGRRRILCAREIQRSIRESSHRLLSDQIDRLRVSPWFEVQQHVIACQNGSEFIFEGLFANVTKVKSLEGVDIAWVEEAAKVSAYSWDMLIPTIRKPGSQIIINFNPEDADDPTYQRFVVHPPPTAHVQHTTWKDNPWFPLELGREREYLASVDADSHSWIWEGRVRTISEAAVFAGKYRIESFEPEPSWNGPFYGCDFGFSQDPTTLARLWISDKRLFVDYEAYQIGCDIDKTAALFDQVPGSREHVIRADCARPETISYLRQHGFPRIEGVEKWPNSVMEGVQFLRSFESITIHPRCTHAADEFRLYAFKTDRLTGDVLPVILDRHNHIVDACRYALQPLMRRAGGGIWDYYASIKTSAASNLPPPLGVITPIETS